jgi:hypothetical protein
VAEKITLHLGAPDRLQDFHLLLRLYAFGCRSYVEAFCETGHCVDDRKRFGAVRKILNE